MQETFFICKNCGQKVSYEAIGTKNRNHCPYCLWSLHIDNKIPGDRVSPCQGLMEPISLAFKKDVVDKYGKIKKGELMVVHKCQICGKMTKNRISGDDEAKVILDLCNENNRLEVKQQLFGK